MLKLNLKINKTHTCSSFQNGEVAVEDHHSPISALNFSTSREVLPHHEVDKGILESSASGNTSLNVLPKALLTVSVHNGDRVFEIKPVVDPGVSVSEVQQLPVGSRAVCVDRRTRQNPTLNERQDDGCCPLTPGHGTIKHLFVSLSTAARTQSSALAVPR